MIQLGFLSCYHNAHIYSLGNFKIAFNKKRYRKSFYYKMSICLHEGMLRVIVKVSMFKTSRFPFSYF